MLYLKQAFRSLQKNKVFSAFNIVGFAIGFAVCIVIALFAYRESTVNTFFPDTRNTYRLMDAENRAVHFDHAIAPVLKARFPEIVEIAPMAYIYSDDLKENIKVGDKFLMFKEMMSTTNDFFKLTGIPILASASDEPFVDKTSVILSQSSALKLFGHYDIVGKPVHFFGFDFVVSAVAADIPANATFGAEVYLNDAFSDVGFMQNCNNDNDCYLIRELYLTVQKGTDAALLAEKMNAAFPENRTKIERVSLQPVTAIYFAASADNLFSQDKTGNKKLLWLFIAIAALTLFMSVFNYVNYTISKQLKTLKQMGIRMAAGAGNGQILRYYLVETGLSVLIAFGLGLFVAKTALPLAERLLETPLDMRWLLQPQLLWVFAALLALVVVLSAWFPMSLLARTDITTLLGKSPKPARAHTLSRLMSVAQLTVSIVLLACLLLINKQLDFVKTANYGFQTEQLLQLDIPSEFKEYKVMKEAFSKLPFIENLSLTSHSPGSGWSRSGSKTDEGEEVMINTMNVDADFVKTFGMKILADNGTPTSEKGVLITETTLKQLEWDDFRGRKLFGRDVLGVVNEFQYNSMHTLVGPVAFIYSDRYYSALNIRLLPGNFGEQLARIRKTWSQLGIEQPLQFQFYDEYFNLLYRKEDREAKALVVFSVIAFIITCLGLLAQIMQITERRVKEIGIRKINGAGIGEIMAMLNKEFLLAVAASFVIATPIAYFAVSQWLQSFAYKTALSWWVFVISGIIALCITLFTVSWQSWRAATKNPVEALRYE